MLKKGKALGLGIFGVKVPQTLNPKPKTLNPKPWGGGGEGGGLWACRALPGFEGFRVLGLGLRVWGSSLNYGPF